MKRGIRECQPDPVHLAPGTPGPNLPKQAGQRVAIVIPGLLQSCCGAARIVTVGAASVIDQFLYIELVFALLCSMFPELAFALLCSLFLQMDKNGGMMLLVAFFFLCSVQNMQPTRVIMCCLTMWAKHHSVRMP